MTIAEREGVTLICSSGKRRCISSEAAVISTSTRRSKLRERSSSSQISSETSPGASPLTRTCVGVTTSASATVGSVTETRFSLSVVLIGRDLPTITRSGAAPGVTLWPDAGVVVVEGCAAGAVSWEEAVAGCGLPSGVTVRANIVVARSKAAATSVRAFMNSDLCEDARANPSRADPSTERADANRCGIDGSKLGFIPFAATDHFYRVRRRRWRRNFRHHLANLGFGLGRHRFIPQVQRTYPRRADASLFCVQRIAQRQLNSSFLRSQCQLLRVVRRDQECNYRGGLRLCGSVPAQALAHGDDRDVFEDGGGLTFVAAALITG